MTSRTPDLFILGAPKSGTTSLYEYLKGHPEVFMSVVKEPCYFSRDLALDDSGNFLVFGRDEKHYFDLFNDAGDAKRVGEGSTRYLYSNDAPALILEAQPNPFAIAMLRNPVDMIQSLHAHKLAAGTEDEPDFEKALAHGGRTGAGTLASPNTQTRSWPRTATERCSRANSSIGSTCLAASASTWASSRT